MSQEQVRAAAAAKSAAPLRVTPQWVTPPLVSKPGVGMPKKKALQVVDLIPPPPSKPVPSVLSRQAQRQDASDLNDMLAGMKNKSNQSSVWHSQLSHQAASH